MNNNNKDEAQEGVDTMRTDRAFRNIQRKHTVKEQLINQVVTPAVYEYDVKKSTQNRIERDVVREVDHKFNTIQDDYIQQAKINQTEFDRRQKEATTEAEIKAAEDDFQSAMNSAMNSLQQAVKETITETIQEKPQEIVEKLEKHKAEEEKQSIEDEVRAHLRGFARTIPSLLWHMEMDS